VSAATRAELREAARNFNVEPGDAAYDATWVRLHNAAIDHVSALLTNDADSVSFTGDRAPWLKFVHSNSHAFAKVLEDLKYLKR
jgi:hypothetical protein